MERGNRIVYYERFNSGRRGQLIQQCISAIHQGKKVYYILPSREAMFDIRNGFVKSMGGIFNCSIIGFENLEDEILGDTFIGRRKINELEQRLLLEEAMTLLDPDNIFKPVENKPGFLMLFGSTLSRLKRLYTVTSELKEISVPPSGLLQEKWSSFIEMMKIYEDLKSKHGLYDVNDVSISAVSQVHTAAIFKQPILIVIDGFINIDPVNLQLVKEIIDNFPETELLVNVPFKNSNNEQFLKAEILGDFRKLGFLIQEDGEPAEQSLAANLYGNSSGIAVLPERLKIRNSPCLDHEVRTTAKAVRHLMEGGVLCSEIAIILTDPGVYQEKIIEIFEAAQIPVAIRRSWPLSSIPVVKGTLLDGESCGIDMVIAYQKLDSVLSEGIIDDRMWIRDRRALQLLEQNINMLYAFYHKIKGTDELEMPIVLQSYILEIAAELEIRDIGKNLNGVKIISPDMVRDLPFKHIFVLGLNEGHFPKKDSKSTIFDGYEIKMLNEAGIGLPCGDWELEREKIRFNAVLASAAQSCTLSYRTADEDGGVMIASPFVEEVLRLIDKDSKSAIKIPLISMRERVREMAESICEQKHHPYIRHAGQVEMLREGTAYSAYDGMLTDPRLAQQSQTYTFSASQLNDYSSCCFRYFARAVLGAGDKSDGLMDHLDTGTFYHEVLHDYHKRLENPAMADETLLMDVFDKRRGNLKLREIPKPLLGYVMDGLRAILLEFAQWDAQNQARYKGVTGYCLKPLYLEQPFHLDYGQDGTVIKGKIDRIDLEVDGDGQYTGRYILYDYKKGGIKSVKECIQGSDYQLPLYHRAFQSGPGKSLPCKECVALMYYSIENREWNGLIRKDYKKALFEGRKGPRSVMEKENMDVVLEWSQNRVAAQIQQIRKGHFMIPSDCPNQGMYPCDYQDMCRYERTRLERKEAVER